VVKFSSIVASGKISQNITLTKNTNYMVLTTERLITTSPYTTVHYFKVMMGTDWNVGTL